MNLIFRMLLVLLLSCKWAHMYGVQLLVCQMFQNKQKKMNSQVLIILSDVTNDLKCLVNFKY